LAIVTIEPESKSWIWVLERKCEECGFDSRAFPAEQIGALSRAAVEAWPELLSHPLARVRPAADRWSALEYGCHVRDVYRLGVYRVQRMLHEDDPRFENWDQDETAVADRYDLQDPLQVATEIVEIAAAFADAYDKVEPGQWQRPGLRSDGSPFTVESFGRYFVHDPMHHLFDVRKGFELLNDTA
jgi:DinB superfamily